MNNFGNWCLLTAFHIYVTALKLCSTFGSTYMCEAAFYRAALYATRFGDRKVVCPSVCPCVCPFVRQTRAFVTKRKYLAKKSSIITRKSTTSFPMSIRLTANALQAPKGVSKRKVTVFRIQKWAFLEESVKTFSGKVVRHSLA